MRRKRASHLAMMQQRAERVQTAQRAKAPVKQGDRSVFCDVELKVIQRKRGRGNKRKEGDEGGVARRKRASHLAKAQHRVEQGQRPQRVRRAHCDVVLKVI